MIRLGALRIEGRDPSHAIEGRKRTVNSCRSRYAGGRDAAPLLVAGGVQRSGESQRRAGQSEVAGGRVCAVSRWSGTARTRRAPLFASRYVARIWPRRGQWDSLLLSWLALRYS